MRCLFLCVDSFKVDFRKFFFSVGAVNEFCCVDNNKYCNNGIWPSNHATAKNTPRKLTSEKEEHIDKFASLAQYFSCLQFFVSMHANHPFFTSINSLALCHTHKHILSWQALFALQQFSYKDFWWCQCARSFADIRQKSSTKAFIGILLYRKFMCRGPIFRCFFFPFFLHFTHSLRICEYMQIL